MLLPLSLLLLPASLLGPNVNGTYRICIHATCPLYHGTMLLLLLQLLLLLLIQLLR
jgi:hypothetical protein